MTSDTLLGTEKGLTPIGEHIAQLERALAKFERAQMPELKDFDAVVKQLECGGWQQTSNDEMECVDQAQAMAAEYLVKLRTFAAAATVRAEEAEKDSRRLRHCLQYGFPVRNQTPADKNHAWVCFGADKRTIYRAASALLAIDAALQGKE